MSIWVSALGACEPVSVGVEDRRHSGTLTGPCISRRFPLEDLVLLLCQSSHEVDKLYLENQWLAANPCGQVHVPARSERPNVR